MKKPFDLKCDYKLNVRNSTQKTTVTPALGQGSFSRFEEKNEAFVSGRKT